VADYAARKGLSTTDYSWLLQRTGGRRGRPPAEDDGGKGPVADVAAALPRRTRKSVFALLQRMYGEGRGKVRHAGGPGKQQCSSAVPAPACSRPNLDRSRPCCPCLHLHVLAHPPAPPDSPPISPPLAAICYPIPGGTQHWPPTGCLEPRGGCPPAPRGRGQGQALEGDRCCHRALRGAVPRQVAQDWAGGREGHG
jgi:hypothetical protein